MSFSSFIPAILAACWLVPVLLLTALYVFDQHSGNSEDNSASDMSTCLKGIRAEVGQPELDARQNAWRRPSWNGPVETYRDRMTDSSAEIMVLVPYAEASVAVQIEGDDTEFRRCTLCLN